jgi:hypothetical protein
MRCRRAGIRFLRTRQCRHARRETEIEVAVLVPLVLFFGDGGPSDPREILSVFVDGYRVLGVSGIHVERCIVEMMLQFGQWRQAQNFFGADA